MQTAARHLQCPTATAFPTTKATVEQVQAWLYASGFDGTKLGGMDGQAIFAMSEEGLNALTAEGTAVYIAVHCMHPAGLPVEMHVRGTVHDTIC